MKESDLTKLRYGTELLKKGFAKMQKGGVVMDVTNAEQAKIAEDSGAIAVMALERVPADIRATGGVARMAVPEVIELYLLWQKHELVTLLKHKRLNQWVLI